MRWTLECLMCGARPGDLLPSGPSELVRLQEHAMEAHGVTQRDLEGCQREGEEASGGTWRLPDGRPWLKATPIREGLHHHVRQDGTGGLVWEGPAEACPLCRQEKDDGTL